MAMAMVVVVARAIQYMGGVKQEFYGWRDGWLADKLMASIDLNP